MVSLKPNDIDARLDLASAYEKEERYNDAIEQLEIANNMIPGDFDYKKIIKGFIEELEQAKQSQISDTSTWKTYRNEEYGFEIVLPASWKGYSILNKFWNGNTLDGSSMQYQGPEIIIRNPKWTINQPWQDIPILVFTKQEWKLIEAQNLGIFAAPIGPSKLGENQKYIFALPPRWIGFTDDLGQNEAEEIIKTFKFIE